MSILPKDLKTDEVIILKERIDEAVCLGFILDDSMKQKLTHTDPENCFKKAIKILEGQMADEYGSETRLLDIEEPRDQWVHDEGEEKADERWVLDEDHEEERAPVEEQDMSSDKALEHFELAGNLGTPKTNVGSTDGTGSCFACYYPMIGIFDTTKRMEEAFKKTQRPGEMAKIEAQGFDNFDRAMGALQGRYPDLTMGDLNDFQMAEQRTTHSTWSIPDSALLLGGLILVVLIVGAVLHPGDKPSGLPIANSMEIPEGVSSGKGWVHAEGYGAGREIQPRVDPRSGPVWTTTEGCHDSVMSGKRPNLGGVHGGEATTNEVKRTEFWPP